MRFLSLFSGIEAASVAWQPLGWRAVAFAEIEPFPCAVLAHHYPDVPNLGDVSQITDTQIAALGRIDLVAGGSPCQDLSLAGKRAGLAGERSGLFHEQIRIFHAARHFCGARWLLWENVPGVFSSNGGRDFAEVVGAMAGCRIDVPAEGWGSEGVALGAAGLVEWCVLDAQWFGVAQRRRRVFALLDTGNWAGRAPVLLERDSLLGDSAPSREAGQEVAGTIGSCSPGGGLRTTDLDGNGAYVVSNAEGSTGLPFLTASNLGKTVNNQTPLIAFPANLSGTQCASAENLSPTLGAKNPTAVAYAFQPRIARNGRGDMGDVVNALAAQSGETGKGDAAPCVALDSAVRRLTPVECERLMGFPDDYTYIPTWDGWRPMDADETPDQCRAAGLEVRQSKTGRWRVKDVGGPRYRALGNSWAVPVAAWIGRRIDVAGGAA